MGTALKDGLEVNDSRSRTPQTFVRSWQERVQNMAGSNHKNGSVFIYNKTRETFVATEVTVADGYFSRLVGLLGKTKRWAKLGKALWIIPSQGVHTIGMLFPIDLIYLDKEKQVVHVEEFVRPFRVSKVSLKTRSVIELPPHTIYRTGTQIGDQIEIKRLA